MIKDTLLEIFERDLLHLKDEINLYTREEDLWLLQTGISNTAGNLCLHLIGNLNHFIGAILGNSGYVRRRDDEFSLKNVPRADINMSIDETIEVVNKALNGLNAADFEADFPLEKHGRIVRTDFMLLHLVTHFNYHLGQINYHRRLLTQA